jgi:hypothetical protein
MAQALAALILALCLAFPAAAAQSSKKPPKPDWAELTPAQQQVLAPVQSEWDQLDTVRRKKWLAIADRYPTMKPAEQQRLQKRMQEWAKLTPDERRAARENYKKLKGMPPKERKELKQRWQEYEQSRTPPAEAAPPPAPQPATATPPG